MLAGVSGGTTSVDPSRSLDSGSVAGAGVPPQGGAVRVVGRRTTERRMRPRGGLRTPTEGRPAGLGPPVGRRSRDGLARRRQAASPSGKAPSPPHPRCCSEANGAAPRSPPSATVRRERAPVASRLLLVVQLSSERKRQPVRKDCSVAKKRVSPCAPGRCPLRGNERGRRGRRSRRTAGA
jgi:hypothetical protein